MNRRGFLAATLATGLGALFGVQVAQRASLTPVLVRCAKCGQLVKADTAVVLDVRRDDKTCADCLDRWRAEMDVLLLERAVFKPYDMIKATDARRLQWRMRDPRPILSYGEWNVHDFELYPEQEKALDHYYGHHVVYNTKVLNPSWLLKDDLPPSSITAAELRVKMKELRAANASVLDGDEGGREQTSG